MILPKNLAKAERLQLDDVVEFDWKGKRVTGRISWAGKSHEPYRITTDEGQLAPWFMRHEVKLIQKATPEEVAAAKTAPEALDFGDTVSQDGQRGIIVRKHRDGAVTRRLDTNVERSQEHMVLHKCGQQQVAVGSASGAKPQDEVIQHM